MRQDICEGRLPEGTVDAKGQEDMYQGVQGGGSRLVWLEQDEQGEKR